VLREFRIVRCSDSGFGRGAYSDARCGDVDADAGRRDGDADGRCHRDADARRCNRDADGSRLGPSRDTNAGSNSDRDTIAKRFVPRLHADAGLDRNSDGSPNGDADAGSGDSVADAGCGNPNADADAGSDGNAEADGHPDRGAHGDPDGVRYVADSDSVGNDGGKYDVYGCEPKLAGNLHLRGNDRQCRWKHLHGHGR
jgi:hypothetical protein